MGSSARVRGLRVFGGSLLGPHLAPSHGCHVRTFQHLNSSETTLNPMNCAKFMSEDGVKLDGYSWMKNNSGEECWVEGQTQM